MNPEVGGLDLTSVIVGEVQSAVRSFLPNELAYLALTSKVELPIRDRLAFALHLRLGEQGFVVAREWRRVDIAVLRDAGPLAFIQLKAAYTFDAFSSEYQQAILGDFEKCQSLRYPMAQNFALLLATHPHGEPVGLPRGVIKYAEKIRRSFKPHNTHETIASNHAAKIAAWNGAKVLNQGELPAGEAFGVAVSIHYWLFDPPATPPRDDLLAGLRDP